MSIRLRATALTVAGVMTLALRGAGLLAAFVRPATAVAGPIDLSGADRAACNRVAHGGARALDDSRRGDRRSLDAVSRRRRGGTPAGPPYALRGGEFPRCTAGFSR